MSECYPCLGLCIHWISHYGETTWHLRVCRTNRGKLKNDNDGFPLNPTETQLPPPPPLPHPIFRDTERLLRCHCGLIVVVFFCFFLLHSLWLLLSSYVNPLKSDVIVYSQLWRLGTPKPPCVPVISQAHASLSLPSLCDVSLLPHVIHQPVCVRKVVWADEPPTPNPQQR